MAWSESALWMCPSCGTSNVEGTRYCERCHLPLVPPPPPTSHPAGISGPAPPSAVAPPPRRRSSRSARGTRFLPIWVAVAVIVVIAASLVFLHRADPGVLGSPLAAPPAAPSNSSSFTVHVTDIEYEPARCWANSTEAGFSVTGGTVATVTLPLANTGTQTCVVNAASALTNGFSIASENTPLSVPPSKAGSLSLRIQTPNFDVDQPLVLSLAVSEI
jgi:hypothetical protein